MKSTKVLVTDLNPCITCKLCSGYYVDATTLVDCMHTFCRGCILKHFENNKMECPTCKKKNHNCFKSDLQLQTLIYKMVPGLYAKEMQRREEFYRSTRVRASSSCSDDSVLGDMMQDHEEWVHSNIDDNQFLSPDDSISLSLEYYQYHMDETEQSTKSTNTPTVDLSTDSRTEITKNNGRRPSDTPTNVDSNKDDVKKEDVAENKENESKEETNESEAKEEKMRDRRYLQCPAAVSMTHLQKFLRMKYALSQEHKVDIIYEGEVLPSDFSLMDVAYTFKWQRVKPMRFFYRIFTPLKIRPIKIINTSSTGQKQLQIVPVKPAEHKPTISEISAPTLPTQDTDTEAENNQNKERLMAELQLQSKSKALEMEETKVQIPRYGKTYERVYDGAGKSDKKKHSAEGECVYDYEETDKEEMKRFAEKRDREWQLFKHPDEEHRISKKRKKNKHSKNEPAHKKRKLHAEITKSEESLKLKVKLTPHNGHKHKHHKTQSDRPIEASSKEKLLQMRQIRHKVIEDKTQETKAKESGETQSDLTITVAKPNEMKNTEIQTKTSETQTKTNETKANDIQMKSSETQTNPQSKIEQKPQIKIENKKSDKDVKVTESPVVGKTLRTDFLIKTAANKDFFTKPSSVQIERNELVEKHAQKTFLKTFQSYADQKLIKKSDVRIESAKKIVEEQQRKLAQNKSLHQQFSRLAHQCTIKPKETPAKLEAAKHEAAKRDKKVTFSAAKPPQILNTQYHSGFTVSKVESGLKRKPETEENTQDKRPSLEITLINPTTVTAPPKQSPTTVKRPPPPTIPLERIKKSFNSGISIIPKLPEKCDNVVPLDLSKPHKSAEIIVNKPNGLPANGLKISNPDKVQLSNLQMLSKVASEHQSLKKPLPLQNKPKPQMPNLQTIKIPNPTNQTKTPNLAKLPKLNEINKSQFKAVSSLRNMRPNQNQSIRNIPNPSLLVRQQNQSRLNLNSSSAASSVQNNVDGKETKAPAGGAEKKDELVKTEKEEIKKS